ncbi:MAG: electron transport complex subunit RsxG [Pseudomonadota bacterium]
MNFPRRHALGEALSETLSTSLTLLLFSVVCAGLLAGTYLATRPTIERSELEAKMRLVTQALPAGSFDNDPVRDAQPLPADPLLGLRHPGLAYVAASQGKPTAVVLEAVAPDGYAGEIKLLIGILADGSIAGVRVTSHKETPGLGDYIDIAKNDWIKLFTGKSAQNPAAEGWRVRKDGGQFDYLAGATVTPRAVVKAVHKALNYFEAHRQQLLRLPEPKPKETP